MSDERLDRAAARVHTSLDALLANLQDVERRDPRFVAAMRRYGILPRMQEVIDASGALSGEVARVFRERGIE